MQQHISVNLDQLSKDGKNFKWEKPKICSCCGNPLWGHGYVGRYFDGYTEKLWLKRYRCTSCKKIITMVPIGFVKYFSIKLSKIYIALIDRLKNYQWPPWISRQRGGHWLKKLKLYCLAKFGINESSLDLKNKIQNLYQENINFLSG